VLTTRARKRCVLVVTVDEDDGPSDRSQEDANHAGKSVADVKFVLPSSSRILHEAAPVSKPKSAHKKSFSCDPNSSSAEEFLSLGLPFVIAEFNIAEVMNRILKDALDVLEVGPVAVNDAQLRLRSVLNAPSLREGAPGPSGDGWRVFFDDSSQRWYEYHAASDGSRWVPKNFITDLNSGAEHAAAQLRALSSLPSRSTDPAWGLDVRQKNGNIGADICSPSNRTKESVLRDLLTAQLLAATVRRDVAEFSTHLEQDTGILHAIERRRFRSEYTVQSNGTSAAFEEHTDVHFNHENVIRARHGELAVLRVLHIGASAAVDIAVANASTASQQEARVCHDRNMLVAGLSNNSDGASHWSRTLAVGARVESRWREGSVWYDTAPAGSAVKM